MALFGDLNRTTIIDLARLSSSAYDHGSSLSTNLTGSGWGALSATDLGFSRIERAIYFDFKGFYNHFNAEGFVARQGDALAIVFRGVEPLKVANILTYAN